MTVKSAVRFHTDMLFCFRASKRVELDKGKERHSNDYASSNGWDGIQLCFVSVSGVPLRDHRSFIIIIGDHENNQEAQNCHDTCVITKASSKCG